MISEILQRYFFNPILYGTGYNILNTFSYAMIFIAASFGIFKLLCRLKIEIDKRFFIGLLPFIIFGSVLRVLEDAGIVVSYFFVSPLIYVTVFAIALPCLLISFFIGKRTKTPYHLILFSVGLFIILCAVKFLSFASLIPLAIVLLLLSFFASTLFLIKKFFNPCLLTNINSSLLMTHLFDASTTFTAMSFFGYWEQHVLARFMMGFIGPVAMFVIKLAVLLPILWILDKEIENKQTNKFIKFVIFILGFAPGSRNLLRMMMGV